MLKEILYVIGSMAITGIIVMLVLTILGTAEDVHYIRKQMQVTISYDDKDIQRFKEICKNVRVK